MNDTATNGNRKITLFKKIAFSVISVLVILVVVSILGELSTRLLIGGKYRKQPIPPPYDTAQKDEYLGWKMTPNYSYTGPMRDKNGEEREVSIRYDANGFKEFGDTASLDPKVFFIGDSYTASIEVSNKNSFFNIIKDSLGIEIFAYGHAGFGSLQEYMVIDQWIDQIKPDLIIWETCSNDFIDNYAPLEIECGYKVGERRPYLNGRWSSPL